MELITIYRVLTQSWKIVLAAFIVTVVATMIFTLRQPKIYEARATYVTNLSTTIRDNKDFASVLDILSRRIEIATTYAEVAKSRRLNVLASQKLGLPPEIRQNLSVNSRLIAGANIIEITVQGTDPILVRDFTNAVGESTIEYVRNLYETFTMSPLDEATTPRRPIQPKTTLNLILGGLLGLALGAGIAFLAYYLQTPNKYLTENNIQASRDVQDFSITEFRQDLMTIHSQFEATRQELDQIQAALRRTNNYAKDIRSVVRDLEAHLEGNHIDAGKNPPGENNS